MIFLHHELDSNLQEWDEPADAEVWHVVGTARVHDLRTLDDRTFVARGPTWEGVELQVVFTLIPLAEADAARYECSEPVAALDDAVGVYVLDARYVESSSDAPGEPDGPRPACTRAAADRPVLRPEWRRLIGTSELRPLTTDAMSLADRAVRTRPADWTMVYATTDASIDAIADRLWRALGLRSPEWIAREDDWLYCVFRSARLGLNITRYDTCVRRRDHVPPEARPVPPSTNCIIRIQTNDAAAIQAALEAVLPVLGPTADVSRHQ